VLGGGLALGLAVAAVAAWLLVRGAQPYQGYAGGEQFVEIPAGSGSRAIGDRLVAAGVIRDVWAYRVGLWRAGQARRLQAGEYRFATPMTPLEVVDMIARGEVYVVNVTFPEGLTIAEMARVADAHGFGPASAFVAAARNPSAVVAIDPAAGDLEGYLFPDTYPLSRHTQPAGLVSLMSARFRHVFTPELQAATRARGLTPRQAVTLASIVEKETARPDERPLVAAVYENRLRIGMPLQCDPTVIFALTRAGRYSGNLHKADLSLDSPYNTYRYGGLPPGPIAAPGRASLEAVAHPAPVAFLYFVSRNDGSHAFARTLAEHNDNVHKWQVEYFQRRRAGQAGAAARPK
jgi:UPF0755 protein